MYVMGCGLVGRAMEYLQQEEQKNSTCSAPRSLYLSPCLGLAGLAGLTGLTAFGRFEL